MRRLTLLGTVAAVLVALVANNLTAQDRPSRVVYLNSQAAIHAHPAGAAIETLRAQARADIEELVAGLTELEQKAAGGQELTPDEADRYRTLQTTLMAVDERYKREIEEAAEPARLAVDQALAELSQEHDYTMVLDSIVAADLGLIVYADPSLDITQLVIDRVSGQ